MQCVNEHLISLLKQNVLMLILIAKMFSSICSLIAVYLVYLCFFVENNLLYGNQFET